MKSRVHHRAVGGNGDIVIGNAAEIKKHLGQNLTVRNGSAEFTEVA